MIFCKLKRKISSGSLQKRKIKTRDAATPSPGDENPDKICDNHEQPRSRSWTAPAAQFRCVVVVVTVLWPVRTHVRSRKISAFAGQKPSFLRLANSPRMSLRQQTVIL